MQEVISDALKSAETGRCSQCGSPVGDGTGSLCQRCSDYALLDIALTLGVSEIWSEDWDEGYPNPSHPIWGVLVRTLDSRDYGNRVEDLYPVLDELGTLRTMGIVESPTGDFAVDIVDFPSVDGGKAWLARRTIDDRATLEAAAHGPERLSELNDLATDLGITPEPPTHPIPWRGPELDPLPAIDPLEEHDLTPYQDLIEQTLSFYKPDIEQALTVFCKEQREEWEAALESMEF